MKTLTTYQKNSIDITGCNPEYIGIIDSSFKEIDLSGFLNDNPNLIADLKKKYSIK